VPSPELFQQILDAYYEAEFCNAGEQIERTEKLEALIDQAIAGTVYTRSWFVEIMGKRYKDYRKARKKREGIPPGIIEGTRPDISN
jgi:hypothetical protein